MLLFILYLIEIPLGDQPIKAGFPNKYFCWGPGKLGATPEGFLVNDDTTVWMFGDDGSLSLAVNPGFDWVVATRFGDRLIVSGGNMTGEEKTRAYDEGVLVVERPGFFKDMVRVGDRLYGFVYGEAIRLAKHPPLCVELDPETLETIDTFFKAPREIVQHFRRKHVWITEINGAHAFMGLFHPYVYFVDDAVRAREREVSLSANSLAPFLELPVDRGPPAKDPYILDEMMPTDRADLLVFLQTLGVSENRFFGSVDGGYVFCFEVTDQIEGFNIGKHLGIQFLNPDFSLRGRVLHRFGQVMGVHRGHLAVFYQQGRVEIAGTEEASRAFYEIDRIGSVAFLKTLQARHRDRREKRYKPVVELISAEMADRPR